MTVVRVDVAIPPLLSVRTAWNMNPGTPNVMVRKLLLTIPSASTKPECGGGITVQRTSVLGKVQVKVVVSPSGQTTVEFDVRVAKEK